MTTPERAAIYARKSTSQRDVSEDAKSITRQVEGARAFIAAQGWTLAEDHVYAEEEGKSGALWLGRPEFQRMAGDAASGYFDVLVLFDLDRLGRDSRGSMEALHALADKGVEVWDYGSRQRVDLDEWGEATTYLRTLVAQQARASTRKNVRHALHRKAAAGLVAGSKCFGYTNVRIAKGHVERVVNEEQAKAVRRIFAEFAAGRAILQIAIGLNDDGTKPPRKRLMTDEDKKKREKATVVTEIDVDIVQPEALQMNAVFDNEPSSRNRVRGHHGWTATTVRGILIRPIYRGTPTYGKTRNAWGNRELGGRRTKRDGTVREKGQVSVPEDAWIRASMPELRIIDESVLAAVDARLAADEARQQTARERRPGSVPHRAHMPKYLGTHGVLICDTCGGNYEVANKRHYVCGTHRRKGQAVCPNRAKFRVDRMDAILVEACEDAALDPRTLDDLLALIEDGGLDPRPRLEADRTRLQGELANVVNSIAKGRITDMEAADELARIRTELAKVESDLRRPQAVRPSRVKLRAALERRLVEWREVLRGEPQVAQSLIKRLMVPLEIGELDAAPAWALVPGGLPAPGAVERQPCEVELRPTALLDGIVPHLPSAARTSTSRGGCCRSAGSR